MEITKGCKGCRCSKCRWQGTDNCLYDRESRCWHCDGKKTNVPFYAPRSFECRGYEKRKG